MSLQSADGYDLSGNARKVVESVYTLSQRKAGRIHAYLLDDAGAFTLVDTLYDDDGALIVRAIQQMGRKITDLKNIHPYARAPITHRRSGGAEEAKRRQGVGTRVRIRHHRR